MDTSLRHFVCHFACHLPVARRLMHQDFAIWRDHRSIVFSMHLPLSHTLRHNGHDRTDLRDLVMGLIRKIETHMTDIQLSLFLVNTFDM